jgi:hypothetical protein
MTDKNDAYEYEELLREIEVSDESGELRSMLKDLSASPSKYGRAEPPAGYENQLIAALRTRLPLERPKAAIFSSQAGFLSRFMASSKMAWSFSGVMAVFVAVMAFQSLRQNEVLSEQNATDYLAQTARLGSSEAVERWVASVADLGVQAQLESTLGLAQELSAMDPALANQALEDVARSFGYKEGI